jgi:integrase
VALCERLVFDDGGFGFIDVSGRRHPLPQPANPVSFWAAVDKAEDIGKRLAAGERKTFRGLIVEFKDSDAYKKKIAANTRKEYDRYLDMVEAAWGDDPVASLTPVDAQKAIDSYQETPSAARYFRAVLSRVIAWGVPRGYRMDNPVERTEKIDSDGTYEPWPDWAFEVWFQHARLGLHLPVYTGLFTGQRSIDVFKMRRPPVKATEMPIFAQKTGEYVPIQIHSEYRTLIDATLPKGDVKYFREDELALHLREDGEAWTLAGARTAWQREITFEPPAEGATAADREKAVAMKRLRDARVVFHGLRKNAVIMLLEAGCTEKEVEKIVGMSAQMVDHYAKRVSARRLAIAAMKKLEAGWSEVRANVFGKVGTV